MMTAIGPNFRSAARKVMTELQEHGIPEYLAAVYVSNIRSSAIADYKMDVDKTLNVLASKQYIHPDDIILDAERVFGDETKTI